VQHERLDAPVFSGLTQLLFAHAADSDRSGDFPAKSFDVLRSGGHIAAPPVAASDIGTLLHLLAAVGRGCLSTGRIFEGHCNALLLIDTCGTAAQRAAARAVAAKGGVFGVWNTDMPGNPLRLEDGLLVGAKNFGSGVDGLSHAIVTIATPAGRQMLFVPLEDVGVDRSWWKPMGMHASGSHIVDFTGQTARFEWALGLPDDYIAQPWFSGGAIRFAAVQLGGMHAVLDVAVEHLTRIRRDEDPYQRQRIARMGIAVETGYAWLDRAAAAWREAAEEKTPTSSERLVSTANAFRTVVETEALSVLELAERSVGAGGFIAPHPLERLVRDLRTYLRQPNPDGALAALGEAIASGRWAPGMNA
jgi:alkylation response protein AidB-like acyl-CoA dehydrogenase